MAESDSEMVNHWLTLVAEHKRHRQFNLEVDKQQNLNPEITSEIISYVITMRNKLDGGVLNQITAEKSQGQKPETKIQ